MGRSPTTQRLTPTYDNDDDLPRVDPAGNGDLDPDRRRAAGAGRGSTRGRGAISGGAGRRHAGRGPGDRRLVQARRHAAARLDQPARSRAGRWLGSAIGRCLRGNRPGMRPTSNFSTATACRGSDWGRHDAFGRASRRRLPGQRGPLSAGCPRDFDRAARPAAPSAAARARAFRAARGLGQPRRGRTPSPARSVMPTGVALPIAVSAGKAMR